MKLSFRLIVVGICLFAITAVLYAPVRNYAFIHLDDNEYVTQNTKVTNGLSLHNVVWAFTHSHSSNWHPATWISHMLDCQLWGQNAGAHHLTNVAFHASNAVILFLVLNAMTGALWQSAFVAALFAWHPLHVESVTWISERKDVLSTFFWFLTMGAYLRYVRQPKTRRYFMVLTCFTLGLMSKPMLVTLPFVLLLLDYWPLGRVDPSRGAKFATRASLRLVLEKFPLFLLAAGSCAVTVLVQQRSGVMATIERIPLAIRLVNAAVSYVIYLQKALWPVDLALFYPYRLPIPGWQGASAVGLLAAITVVAIAFLRRRPYVLVGWGWYLGTLVPVIGLIQVGEQARADRYSYIPLTGFFIMVAWGVPDLLGRARYAALASVCAGVVVLAACIGRTADQMPYWRNSASLFEHSLSIAPRSVLLHNNLGVVYLEQERYEKAIAHWKEALRLVPDFSPAHNNLVACLTQQGRVEEAIAHCEATLRRTPTFVDAQRNLEAALREREGSEQAILECGGAAGLRPDDPVAQFDFANALRHAGRIGEAIVRYEQALRLAPDYSDAHNSLAAVFMQQGRTGEAISHYEAVLRPQSLSSTEGGNGEEAAGKSTQVFEARPGTILALRKLAWIRATHPRSEYRNGEVAVELAERAAELTQHKVPQILGTLAAALAESGRFGEAVRSAEKARDLAWAANQTQLAAETEARLELYRQGLPYRAEK